VALGERSFKDSRAAAQWVSSSAEGMSGARGLGGRLEPGVGNGVQSGIVASGGFWEKHRTLNEANHDMRTILRSIFGGLILLVVAALPAAAQQLTGVTPATGAGGVSTATTVVFTFNTDMEPIQDISWFANGGGFPAQLTGFTYQWTSARRLEATKSGGFPANTMIIWSLNEEGFADDFGFPLESGSQNSGFFTTAAGSGGGGGSDGTGAANVSLIKFANHDQLSAADPVLTTNFIYYFGANASAPQSRALTNVSLTIPGGAVSNLFTTPFTPTNFFLSDVTNSLAALSTKYPSGSYSFALKGPSSNQTVAVTLPATAFPAAPKFSNFTAGQAVDPAASFTLQFNAGGVGTEHVYISITDSQSSDTAYESPDILEPGHLVGTSTSVLLPAGTFQEGRTYEMEIGRWIVSTNLVGGNGTSTGIGSVTRTVLKTIGGAVTTIELKNPSFVGGFFSVEAMLAANQSYSMERSTNATTWESISSVFAVAPSQMFFDFAPPASGALYRVKKD
jgi:hypothetical protein